MAPSRQNAAGNSNAGAMVAALCQSAGAKVDQLRQEGAVNHGHTMAAAQHVAVGGPIQKLLESMGPDVLDPSEVQQFFEEQRSRLKEVAARNADNERTVMALGHACQHLRQDSLRRATAQEALPEDFGPVVTGLVSERAENLVNHPGVQKFVRDVKIQLKEERDVILGGGDGDDDIEVVDGGGTATQGGGLKCPITQMMLEEPYRNKFCGHVYSKEAILGYLRSERAKGRHCKCPTAGCGNTNVTENQLERDAMAEVNVNRERRRIDKQLQDRASQASQVDDDDEEEEEGEATF